jgi:hypothetical protein
LSARHVRNVIITLLLPGQEGIDSVPRERFRLRQTVCEGSTTFDSLG